MTVRLVVCVEGGHKVFVLRERMKEKERDCQKNKKKSKTKTNK
jgi:hypothetical protein